MSEPLLSEILFRALLDNFSFVDMYSYCTAYSDPPLLQVSAMEEKPFSGFMEFLTSGTAESGGSQQSQETQMSSQGFSALALDVDLFAGIKTEEWDEILTPAPNPNTEPVSPVSTASIESMGMEAVDGSLIPAYEASSRKGTLTPLLKQELRCKIQKKRVDAGLDPDLPPREDIPEPGPSQVSNTFFYCLILNLTRKVVKHWNCFTFGNSI